jgi:hypothetical protein
VGASAPVKYHYSYCFFTYSMKRRWIYVQLLVLRSFDLAVRNGPVSSRVALLLRSAEGKPSFASISPMGSPDFWRLVGVGGLLMCRLRTGGAG